MQGVINKASKLDADMDVSSLDLPAGMDAADAARDAFLPYWEEELRKDPKNPSIAWALFWFLKKQIVLATFFALIEAAGPFTSVVLMKFINNYMLSFYTATPDPMWHGGIIVCVFFVMQAIYAVGAGQSTRFMGHQEMRIEAALKMLMARKAISLSGKGLKDAGGAGALFQNFSSDIGQVSQMLPFVWRSTEIFASMLGAFIYLGVIVGWPAISSVVVLCCVIPCNYRIASSFLRYIIAKMMAGDKRTNKVIELLNSVRVIKFYAWEKPFRSVVREMREPELVLVAKLMRQIAFLMASFAVAAPVMQIILYVILVYGVETPSPVVFFQSLSIITILTLVMIRAPFVYSAYLQVQNALMRLTASLTAEDRSDEKYTVSADCEVGEVIIRDATFSWPPERPPPPPALPPGLKLPPEVMKKIAEAAEAAKNAPPMPPKLLKDVNFRANAGDFVMVVGKVGNGKSSLVSAILSEMAVDSGTLARRGSLAYVPQTAWILNGTIRNNVLVHLPYDAERYQRVLEAVDLYVDFKALPNGDLTEVGEKGINLSGGQKQRISLARALYQDADIYVFDDPLSALDAHVGRHVFDVAMMTMLAKKTRILVTHQLQYLQQATRIYVSTDMTLVETPMPDVVPAAAVDGESPLHVLLRAFQATSQASPASPSPSSPSNAKKRAPSPMAGGDKAGKSDGTLTVKEERQSGQVKGRTLLVYLGSFGTPAFWLVIGTLQLLIVCCNVFSQLWMGWWTGNKWPSLNARYPAGFFLGIYAGANVLAALLTLARELTWRTGAVNAPRTLYDRMTNSVLHAPMAFFDTTPVGRIINRFTRDAAQLDFQLPMAANQCITLGFTFLGSSAAICYAVPWSTPVFAAAIIALIFVQPTVAIVVLRRLSSAANGPVFALYSETLAGAVSIRALNIADFCTERFALLVDERNCSAYCDRMAFEYIRLQVNILLGLVSALLMLVIILTRKHLEPTLVIFGINNSMTVTMYMGYVMLQRGQLMMALNSVERMMDYTELEGEKGGSNPAPESWPTTGTVSFQNVTAQYRPGLPHALSDLTFSVNSGEKIGVVGRTGSGKSTLLLTIFRIIPLLGSSKIVIDGVDTGTIPLEQLRSKVAAIPQEPVLFSGTVQDNLDPFRAVPAEKLKEAIAMCHLSAPLEELRAKQDTATAGVPNADGSAKTALDVLDVRLTDADLSVGQKQLLCLARAMARNARIIVLDEATSSVDVHTDAMIQQTIRTAFKEATIITVAHRLNTIMDSDRILVLDQGQLAEFDTPQALLAKEDSIFAGLAAEAQEQHQSPVAA